MQFDQAVRGFSFLKEGPLDMRIPNWLNGANLVNYASEKTLSNILFSLERNGQVAG